MRTGEYLTVIILPLGIAIIPAIVKKSDFGLFKKYEEESIATGILLIMILCALLQFIA